MAKVTRRQFLLSATASLFGGWLSRFWRDEPEPEPEQALSPVWEHHTYVDEWHCYATEWKIGEGHKHYLDGVLQKEPIAWWPIKMSDEDEWELEGDPEQAKHVASRE